MRTSKVHSSVKSLSLIANLILAAALSVCLMSTAPRAKPKPTPTRADFSAWSDPMSYKTAVSRITTYRANYGTSLVTYGTWFQVDSIANYLKKKLPLIEKRMGVGNLPPNVIWTIGNYFGEDSSNHLSLIIIPTLVDTTTGQVYDFLSQNGTYSALATPNTSSSNDSLAYDEGHLWP